MSQENKNSSDKLQELITLAKECTLLYVEDNQPLRDKAVQLFKKFFAKVETAENGEDGLRIFKDIKPHVVISDIKMPVMDGLEMSRRIKKISPHAKIILTSAFDDTEYLLEAVKIGVFRYLKKPLGIDVLTAVLYEVLKQITLEDEDKMFNFYVENIFNHQQNLLVLYNGRVPVIANNTMLDFFQVDDLKEFITKFKSLGEHFLPHKSFLYNHDNIEWFKEAIDNIDHLHHVKMYDSQQVVHHFVFKVIAIKGNKEYYLVSMDDITELGLLKLFDDKATHSDEMAEDKKAVTDLLETVRRNSSEVKIRNFYKGLSLTNKGLVISTNKDVIVLQSKFLQQKAVLYEGKTVLSSDFFPFDILCEDIKNVDFEQQTIEIGSVKFLERSPSQRSSIRLVPEENHTVSFFYQNHKFGDGVTIVDISIDAVKLSMYSLPAGFNIDELVTVDIVFTINKKHLIVHTEAKVFKVMDLGDRFEVVLFLQPVSSVKKVLVEYLSQRQMELIREFKGLQNGK